MPELMNEPIFPFEHWHVHSSCIVECPNGDLLTCWYHGSGERKADDVKVLGARKSPGGTWSKPFLMADTPDFPDTNPVMCVDGGGHLWLFYGTQLDNNWESTLLKYCSTSYFGSGNMPPAWERTGIIHFKPDDVAFAEQVKKQLPEAFVPCIAADPANKAKHEAYIQTQQTKATVKLNQRIGWMGRCRPLVQGERILLPLYSDGFDFSLIAIHEGNGDTWSVSAPMIGPGAVQPSLLMRKDGTIIAYCRNNGPPPMRILSSESKDGGKTWSIATACSLPNPGSSVDGIVLKDGRWLICYNDTEQGRHRLAVSLSEDEGRTWRMPQYIRQADSPTAARYHYPSILQTRDGSIHVTYTSTREGQDIPKDASGQPARETIEYAHFPLNWLTGQTQLTI